MAIASVSLRPVSDEPVLKDRVYEQLKEAILGIDIYKDDDEHRLDERLLAENLGVSRTPVREALCRLENEGFVQNIPRRGAFVARKSKQETLEMITVWAALESMAARLATQHATQDDIENLRRLFTTFEGDQLAANIDEYSASNISFHQSLFRLSGCQLLNEMTENLFLHMRGIRQRTISENDRASRSIIDHIDIINALANRDADRAERLTREHTLNLAAHVQANVDWLK